jgi:hypothetical protein
MQENTGPGGVSLPKDTCFSPTAPNSRHYCLQRAGYLGLGRGWKSYPPGTNLWSKRPWKNGHLDYGPGVLAAITYKQRPPQAVITPHSPPAVFRGVYFWAGPKRGPEGLRAGRGSPARWLGVRQGLGLLRVIEGFPGVD